jgi:uncharacterized protein
MAWVATVCAFAQASAGLHYDAPMISTLDALRQLYTPPAERARLKQLSQLDEHCLRFIALSPFVLLATADAQGLPDCSPRGGAPGFVQVASPTLLRIPDSPGNRRLDSLENILANGQAGLLFLIPGVDETLRVNGHARLNDDAAVCAALHDGKRVPMLVVEIDVHEAYLHCAKAFMRSRLWQPEAQQSRACLAPTAEILRAHTGIETPVETPEQMRARYAPDL